MLQAAVVTARFRNIAERGGKVDLRFQITVPARMRDSRWQLRFYPDMFILGDSLSSDIRGGINAGIMTCWFNPTGKENRRVAKNGGICMESIPCSFQSSP